MNWDSGSHLRLWERHLADHATAFERTRTDLADAFARCADLVLTTLRRDGAVFFCGNGGSAADAQHLAAELTVRFVGHRQALRSCALAMDTSALTACGNDFGFDQVFARQLEAVGRTGDLVVGITTSGNSPNVLRALERARETGIASIALTGAKGGAAAALADIAVIVPACGTATVQEMHITFGHALCVVVDQEFAGP